MASTNGSVMIDPVTDPLGGSYSIEQTLGAPFSGVHYLPAPGPMFDVGMVRPTQISPPRLFLTTDHENYKKRSNALGSLSKADPMN